MSKFNENLWLEKIRKIITLSLSFGRCFATLDKDNNPVVYEALDTPNWEQGEFVVFIETKKGFESNPNMENGLERVRISQLGNTTFYERFDENGKLTERKSSIKFKELPVLCIGSTDLDFDVDILPLEGIATCALHIYKKTADLSYSEFSSCVPTLVMTGVEADTGSNQQVGGGVALVIPNDMAKVYYATADTNALQHVRLHIEGLFEEAKTYGASLLGGDKNEVESAEAIRLRQSAAGASLSTLTRNIEYAVNRLLVLAGFDYKFKINFDLEENYMTPAEQSVLLDAWMSDAISYQTFFNNYQKAGLIEDERDIKSEIEDIKREKEAKQKEIIKLSSVGDNNVSNYDVAKKSTVQKPDPNAAKRTKNLNRQGLDYQK